MDTTTPTTLELEARKLLDLVRMHDLVGAVVMSCPNQPKEVEYKKRGSGPVPKKKMAPGQEVGPGVSLIEDLVDLELALHRKDHDELHFLLQTLVAALPL